MQQIANVFRDPVWQGLGAIFALAGIFVAFYLGTGNIIWLLSILWAVLILMAVLLSILLRERLRKQRPADLHFYSLCVSLSLVGCLLGLSLIAFGDLRTTPISQGDLLETWEYSTYMWEAPALTFPDVELSVESQPSTPRSYVLRYQFQSTTSATYTGANFKFRRPPDLSTYKSIQITYRLSDDRANCSVGLADEGNQPVYKLLGTIGVDNWTTASFPLDTTFPGVNRHAITNLVIYAGNPGDGMIHSCTIYEIRFLKL